MSRRIWTREAMLDCVPLWIEETGQVPAQAEWNVARMEGFAHGAMTTLSYWRNRIRCYTEGHWPSDRTVRDMFGSWNAFIREAGHTPRSVGRQVQVNVGPVTREDYDAALAAVEDAEMEGGLVLRLALMDLAGVAYARAERVRLG